MKTLHACVHVRVLGGTSIPPNVYAINTADTARKTPGCIFFDNSFVRGVISWHVDIKKTKYLFYVLPLFRMTTELDSHG
jgi:uncharacterized protein YbcV (DUF1398 family)